jgi:hypothetical protein
VGPRSTPNYGTLALSAVRNLANNGGRVFAGQRLDGFWVDLGSIFDLGALRPLNPAHLIPSAASAGVNALRNMSVHTIALQVPISQLTANGAMPTNPNNPRSVLGVWTSAHRQRGTVRDDVDGEQRTGPLVQVSRLGNPLINEVVIPMARKDAWNRRSPAGDADFQSLVYRPELAALLPVLYPGAFPNLAAYNANRADLHAILLTGIPSGIVPNFSTFTGPTPADMLRLNVAIPPAGNEHPLGVLGGDLAGFPNGRRPADDVVTIELRAVAGATIPLVDPSYTPDGAVSAVADGTAPPPFLGRFPYLGHPRSGYEIVPLAVGAP